MSWLELLVVNGPGRVYNSTAFCFRHAEEAVICAKEWQEEVDSRHARLNPGKEVTISLEPEDGEGCAACRTGIYEIKSHQ